MEFKKVDDVDILLPILEKRLPYSANVYNVAKFSPKWTKEISWHMLGEELETSMILGVTLRKDWNQEIVISRDLNTPITDEIRKAFLTTTAFNWNDTYRFGAIDTELSQLVYNIGLRDFGNALHTYPCYYHILGIQEAKLLKNELKFGPHVGFGPLSGNEGTSFIMKSWMYATPKAEEHVHKIMSRNVSAGAFVNGEIVSGVGLNTQGLIGMLHTLEEHRGKGYGQGVMHSMMKNCADDGFVPCCLVDIRNVASSALMKKIGLRKTRWLRDVVIYTKEEF